MQNITSRAGVSIVEEVTLIVGDDNYVLIPHGHSFVNFDGAAAGSTSVPVLFVVYPTKPGQTISQESLRNFRADVLDCDDVFQPAFTTHVVFYGSSEQELSVKPDAIEELNEWNTNQRTFVEGDSREVAPGPYVFAKQKNWQPWKVYYDFNATFMCAFKPSPDVAGG